MATGVKNLLVILWEEIIIFSVYNQRIAATKLLYFPASGRMTLVSGILDVCYERKNVEGNVEKAYFWLEKNSKHPKHCIMYYAFWGQTWKINYLLMNMLLIICTTDKTQKSVFHTQHEASGQKVNKDVQLNASYREMVISLNFDDEKSLYYFFPYSFWKYISMHPVPFLN